MYRPKAFDVSDLAELHDLMTSIRLAHLVSSTSGGLVGSIVPLLVDRDRGPHGTLVGHLARANHHWRDLTPGVESMAIFAGPDAYVSPSWYATKQETGKVVPTWNYVAVHAYGELVVHDDPAWLEALVRRLTDVPGGGAGRPVVGRRRAGRLRASPAAGDRRHRAADQPHRGQAQAQPEPTCRRRGRCRCRSGRRQRRRARRRWAHDAGTVKFVAADWSDSARSLTDAVTVLVGPANGAYPTGNTLVVQGAGETVIIDPSVTVAERVARRSPSTPCSTATATRTTSPATERFPRARVHVHHDDLPGVRGLDGLMAVYGLPMTHPFATDVVEQFHYAPRPDAIGFADGHVFDLGGTTVQAVHLPGHTRGHSGFRISGGVFFLSDIDLTGFGPYYGDVWSDLDDFEASLAKVRDEEADYYVTFHHKGIIEGRAEFLRLLDSVRGGHRPSPPGDARLPRRTALAGRDGGAPLRVPAPRRALVHRRRGVAHRRVARATDARPW